MLQQKSDEKILTKKMMNHIMNNKFIKIICLIICLTPIFYGCVNSVDNYPDLIEIKSGDDQCVSPSSLLPKELTVQVLGPHKKGLLGGKGSR